MRAPPVSGMLTRMLTRCPFCVDSGRQQAHSAVTVWHQSRVLRVAGEQLDRASVRSWVSLYDWVAACAARVGGVQGTCRVRRRGCGRRQGR
jgi:hypothetical protein